MKSLKGYEVWNSFGDIVLWRREKFAIAFDGIVKGYELATNKPWLQDAVQNRYFMHFFYRFGDHIFLRELSSPQQWPRTKLIAISLAEKHEHTIAIVERGALDWKVDQMTKSKIRITTLYSDRIPNFRSEGYLIDIGEQLAIEKF